METTVGIRDFKARLSEYMQQVKNGQSIVITEHGKPVGRILPVAMSLEERIEDAAQGRPGRMERKEIARY